MPIPFETLSWLEIVVVVIAYVFGFYVRGSFGFGSNLPIVLIRPVYPQQTRRNPDADVSRNGAASAR